jgi:hypothetical protein
VVPEFNIVDPNTEAWLQVVGWESFYEVSDQGRVRRTARGKGASKFEAKTPTVIGSHAVVSLNRPGEPTRAFGIHKLMMQAFVGPCPDGMEVRHVDGNGLNNTLDNLEYATKRQNADDRVRDGATTHLARSFTRAYIRYAGREMTYDLEVAGPWHNFSACGFVVHNSVNEFSARYSVMKDRFFRPGMDDIRRQSAANKQGSGGAIESFDTACDFLAYLERAEALYGDYEKAAKGGVAREMARIGLPLSIYTEWYWKIDLHNLLHFLLLRMDHHAQQEIRDYADPMYELIQPLVPVACEAWRDYKFESLSLSRLEVEAIKSGQPLASTNKREIAAYAVKKGRLGL